MSPTLLHIFNTFSLTCPDPILEFEAILLKIIGFRPWKQRLCIIKKIYTLVVVKQFKVVLVRLGVEYAFGNDVLDSTGLVVIKSLVLDTVEKDVTNIGDDIVV